MLEIAVSIDSWLARAARVSRRPSSVAALASIAASLAAFRILFGLLMAVSMLRFIALGWVDEFYVLPDVSLHLGAVPVGAAAAAVADAPAFRGARRPRAGGRARLPLSRCRRALFFVGFTYVELIDKTTYLNHYYLVSLLSGLLVSSPAHRVWSVDAWRSGADAGTRTVPAWTVNLLRFQIARRLSSSPASPSSTPTGCSTRSRCASGSRREATCRSSGRSLAEPVGGVRLQLVRRRLRSRRSSSCCCRGGPAPSPTRPCRLPRR